MKKHNIITGLMIAGLMAVPSITMAKDGSHSEDMERSKMMTQERIKTRDQSDGHDALMTRDQTRDQTREQLKDGSGKGIYGSKMMNSDEVKQYRERIHAAKSEKERMKLMKQHRIDMQERAKQKGVELVGEE